MLLSNLAFNNSTSLSICSVKSHNGFSNRNRLISKKKKPFLQEAKINNSKEWLKKKISYLMETLKMEIPHPVWSIGLRAPLLIPKYSIH